MSAEAVHEPLRQLDLRLRYDEKITLDLVQMLDAADDVLGVRCMDVKIHRVSRRNALIDTRSPQRLQEVGCLEVGRDAPSV